MFHHDCVSRWSKLSTTCPTCKAPFDGIAKTTVRAVRALASGASAVLAPRAWEAVDSKRFVHVADVSEFTIGDADVACMPDCLLRSGYGGAVNADDYCIQCDAPACARWYHGVCVAIPVEADAPKEEWRCPRCSGATITVADMLVAAGVPPAIAARGVDAATAWQYPGSAQVAAAASLAATISTGGAAAEAVVAAATASDQATEGVLSLFSSVAAAPALVPLSVTIDVDADDDDDESYRAISISGHQAAAAADSLPAATLSLTAAADNEATPALTVAAPPAAAANVPISGGGGAAPTRARTRRRTTAVDADADAASAAPFAAPPPALTAFDADVLLAPRGRPLTVATGHVLSATPKASGGGRGDVVFVANHTSGPDYCHVCGGGVSEEGNTILLCDGCDVAVHQSCYAVRTVPEGSWLCATCSAGLKGLHSPPCVFCPTVGGAMKCTTDGRWAHSLCVFWVAEATFMDPDTMELVGSIDAGGARAGVEAIPKERFRFRCSVCKTSRGVCTQCRAQGCTAAWFHPVRRILGERGEFTVYVGVVVRE